MTIPLSSLLFSAATMIIGTSSSVATISFKFESAVETRAGLMMSSPDRIASPMVMASLLFRSAFDIAALLADQCTATIAEILLNSGHLSR